MKTLGLWFLLLAALYVAACAYPGMLLVWAFGRLIGAIDMTWWEFTRGWFTLEWLG